MEGKAGTVFLELRTADLGMAALPKGRFAGRPALR
jgi:hypothetical protein